MPKRRASSGRGGPTYSKLAVIRELAVVARSRVILWAFVREGGRTIRHAGERARWRIIARLDVTLRYGLPVDRYRLATKSERALPMPTPWNCGTQTVRLSRQPGFVGCGKYTTAVK